MSETSVASRASRSSRDAPALELQPVGGREVQVDEPVRAERRGRAPGPSARPRPSALTSPTSATGSSISSPSASSIRTRPGRSVTSARPSGRNAISHGTSSPVATTLDAAARRRRPAAPARSRRRRTRATPRPPAAPARQSERPGVHGLVRVHQLAVAHGHLAQRVAAVELRRRRRAGGTSPPATRRRCVSFRQRCSMMPSSRSRSAGRDAPALEALVGHREQPAQHQLGDRDLADARPVHARLDPVARARVEVLLRRRERHLRPDRPVLVDQRAQQPVVEGRVGEDVGDRRAGRQHAVLHAQVRAPAHDVVDRPVPAVDRAVVQPQLGAATGCPRARAPRPGPRPRTPAAAPGSSGRSPRTGRRSTVIQRSPNHTRGRTPWARSSSERVSVACSNSGIRVSRHSSLPKKNGELAAERELDAGDRLGGVPVRAERRGIDLQVQLDARARRLGRDRVGEGGEPLDAGDRDVEVLAAGGEDLLVEQLVARVGAERLRVEVAVGRRSAGSRPSPCARRRCAPSPRRC